MPTFAHFEPMSMETWCGIIVTYGWILLLASVLAAVPSGVTTPRPRSPLGSLTRKPLELACLPILCWALVANLGWKTDVVYTTVYPSPTGEDYWRLAFRNLFAFGVLCCLQAGLLALRGRTAGSLGIRGPARLATCAAISATFLDTFFLLWAMRPLAIR